MKRQWVASSFDDDSFTTSSSTNTAILRETVFATPKPRGSLRPKQHGDLIKKKASTKGVTRKLWSEETVSKDDLAVHKKKVQEVEEWLINAFTGVKGHRLLLLTGPAGCGKTACVRALVAEMGLGYKEWINATSTATPYRNADKLTWTTGGAEWVPGDSVSEVGQVTQFREFVTRVNKYGSVAVEAGQSASSSHVLLVEDLPNAFYRDPAQFHEVLRRYAQSGCSPAVFIISDSPQQEHSAKHLFPPHLHAGLALTCVQFNAVASTLMSKALSQCCVRHDVTAPADLLHSLSESATGDIRTALNALQFSIEHYVPEGDASVPLRGSLRGKKSARSGRGATASKARGGKSCSGSSKLQEPLAAVGGKDPSLELFRAIGKVLYCKRSESQPPCPLPAHLQKEERVPAIETAEVILDKCPMMPTTFLSFLHHNYPPFMSDVDAALTAITYLTDADVMLGYWTEKDVLSPYSSTAVRGLMHAVGSDNGSNKKKKSFRPMTGPVQQTVLRAAAARTTNIRSAYQHQDMQDLTTHIIPYAAKITKNLYTPTSYLVRDVGVLGHSFHQWNSNDTATRSLQSSVDQQLHRVLAPDTADSHTHGDTEEDLGYPLTIEEDSD